MSQPTVKATSPSQLLIAAATGAGGAYLLVQALGFAGQSLPQPGPGGWVPPLIMGAVTAWLAWTTRRTLQVDRRTLASDVAVTRLRIAKAGMLVAAALIAGYLVLLVASLAGWPAPMAQGRILHAALACIACLGWGIASYVLERVCRIPEDPQVSGGEAA